MKKINFELIELGTGITFDEDSPTDKINFKRKYLFTHDDERWNEKPGRQSFYKEVIEMDLHCISHIDSLNHGALNKSGFKGAKYGSDPSTYENGADITPLINGRALMLDFPKYLNVGYLEEKDEITVDLIKGCLDYQKADLEDFDIVLFRTGHIRYFELKEYDRYFEKEVGLSVEAILWLSENKMVALGADNFAVESIPTKENECSNFYPGHKKFLGEKGIYIMENLNLNSLSQKGINEFYFIAAPIRIRHASAALINPIAVIERI